MATIEDFLRLDFRVGTVLEAEEVEDSEKLIKQIVDFGEDGKRQILSGIKHWVKPGQLIGKQFVYVFNFEPRTMMGLESQGMLLTADDGRLSPLKPSRKVKNGAKIK